MERKGTKVNFLYNMVYQVALMILPLITMPYVSRVLGAEGIGTYSYTYSIAQYFLLFGMLGVENYGNRSIARVRDDEQKRSAVFSSIYTLQFIIASISVIVYVLYIAMFSGNKLYAFLHRHEPAGVHRLYQRQAGHHVPHPVRYRCLRRCFRFPQSGVFRHLLQDRYQ